MHAWIGLGANLGDAAATLRLALRELDAIPGTRLARASDLHRTAAWGRTAQPDFVNAVALVDTALGPRELLDALLAIERAAGRDREHAERWGPRVLDLDLLLYDQVELDEPGLRLPHPHLHERAFALVPLLEISPDARIPGIGTARDALAALDSDGAGDVG